MTTSRTPPKVPRPQRAPIVLSPAVSELASRLAAPDLVDSASERAAVVDSFWSAQAVTPLIETVPEDPQARIVTFLWRDADAEQVLLFVNRLTDERLLADSLMRRLPGTDTWHISYRMRSDWRASYAVLRQPRGERAPWTDAADHVAIRAALDRGLADPRNPNVGRNRAGVTQSIVALPDAPLDGWSVRRADVERGCTVTLEGPNGRTVWVHEPPGGAFPGIPVVIALDGEVWANDEVLAATADNLLADGLIRPALLVMPDSGGRDARWDEMDTTGSAVDAVVDQLLLWLRTVHPISADPDDIVIAGQSLGALTALRAALIRPDAIGGALSLSASLWRDDLVTLMGNAASARVHLEVGEQEWVLREPNHLLAARLTAAGADVRFVEYNGGHDYACWRIGMANGLQTLLAPR